MTLLTFLAWWLLLWLAAAVFFGLAIAAMIRTADRHEAANESTPEADTELLYIPREWVA